MSFMGQCAECHEPTEEVVAEWWDENNSSSEAPEYGLPKRTYLRHARRPRPINDRDRTHCSKCGKPGEWFTFKPGSGECNECTT